MPNWQAIGQQISKARLRLGLSKAELARRAGVSLPFLSRLERGQRGTSDPVLLERLAEALNLSGEERIRLYLEAAHLPSELAAILGREELVQLCAELLALEDSALFPAAMGQVAALAVLLAAAVGRAQVQRSVGA